MKIKKHLILNNRSQCILKMLIWTDFKKKQIQGKTERENEKNSKRKLT